ncbi:YceD family protein [Paracoccus sanguinis]|uniref:YceD family protein n=1 Tax=Paracoccus sanguinis TaxID=1545044 RepID=UPI001451A655|nr:DUF177 domain-containing protein [Paracoccus sanguinis]QJD17834.1 DUF177 domain-containing protein [Paracoccus sanguinis]
MTAAPFSQPLRVTQLNPRRPNPVTVAPDEAARARIAAALGLSRLPAARLEATIAATGQEAWTLTGRLTAQVVQPCVVTLAPVETAIDEPVRRVWSPYADSGGDLPEGAEIEMPDDEVEPLGSVVDPGAVLVEALALALPLYPRAPGAALDAAGEAGADADDDPGRRPFAGLAALLGRRDDPPGEGG